MKNEFYLTLPSNSSLADYSNNSSNNFKVRLPAPIRLNGEWKVALASISVPDPKNSLPDWLTDSLPLVYATWCNADSSDSNKKLLDASFLLRDIKDHVDINRLTGIKFMENVFHFLKKKRYFKDSRTNRMYGNSNTKKAYFTEFKVDGDDIILNSSKIETHDFGRGDITTPLGWLSPAIAVNKQLALAMGWIEETSDSNAQFAIKLGPNLIMEPRGYLKPNSTDIRTRWDSSKSASNVLHADKYWIIPRKSTGVLSNYIRLSLDVNWRFTNLNYAFSHMFGKTTRSLFVYSDVGGSSVLGDQMTDLIREVNYQKEGKGSYYFEPEHL